MLADVATGASIYFSCGRWLDEPSVWRELIGISLPGRDFLFAKNYGRSDESTGPGSSLARLVVLEEQRKMRFYFKGPVSESPNMSLLEHGLRVEPKTLCTIDLIFDAAAPVWNMKGDSTEAATIAGSMHIEQIGVVNGSIHYAGHDHVFSGGYGVRDHSRGIRDVSSYRWHCWVNGRFPGNRFFYLYAMQLRDSGAIGMTNAAIFQDGNMYAARLLDSDFLIDPASYRKLRTFVLDSALGKMEIRVAEIVSNCFTSMVKPYDMSPGWTHHLSAANMMDQYVTLSWDGQSGVGWWESGFASQPL
jgi:hypothetical protein